MTKEHEKDIGVENETTTKQYIIIDENMVYNGIKYEIGKTYLIPSGNEDVHNKKFFPEIVNDFERLNLNVRKYFFHQNRKLIEIKIKKDSSNEKFIIKLIKECNYKKLSHLILSSSDVCLNETILAAKLNDKKALDKILKLYLKNSFEDYYGIILIKTNIDKYFKNLFYINSCHIKTNLARFVNRNKYFDKLVGKNEMADAIIISKGINKYLDFYMKEEFEDNMIFREILKQGRFKDIDCFLNSKSKNNQISLCAMISTGIDKYLDYAMKLKDPFLYNSIIKIGRKKDLDILLKEVELGDYYLIIEHGFDEHLDIVSETSKNKHVLRKILEYEREYDLWLKNKLKRDE